jgi:hypothetical protein
VVAVYQRECQHFDTRRDSITGRFDCSTAHNLAMRTLRSHAYAVSYRPLSALSCLRALVYPGLS